MDKSKSKFSHEFLTILSLTNEFLPFYGYADECRQLMTQLRHGSRKLWNQNMAKWFKTLSPVKRTMQVDSNNKSKFEFLHQNYRYAMFKLELYVKNFEQSNAFYSFVEN